MRWAVILCGTGSLLILTAQTWGQSLELSTDTAITLQGTVVTPTRTVRVKDSTVTIGPLGPFDPGIALPAGVRLHGFDRLPDGTVLFSIDVATPIAGLAPPGIAQPADVVHVGEAGPEIAFSGIAAGIPRGVNVDAVGREPNGDLLLSFDSAVQLGSLAVAREDLVRVDHDTQAVTMVYDGSAQGVAAGLNLDGAYRDLDTGHLLLSFDGAGTVGGVTFNARDVLDWDPGTGSYSIAYAGDAAGWPRGANLLDVSGFSDGDGVIGAADNCPFVANSDQSDVGGIGAAAGPDGIGDVCQCGEVDGDGRVAPSDLAQIRRGLAASDLVAFPERCNVIGAVDPTLLASGMRRDCDIADVVVIARALATLGPGVSQVCQSAVR